MLRQLIQDESGVIISAELVLVLTIAVLAMVVGLSEVSVAINTELNDLGNAFGRLDQTYGYTGFSANSNNDCKNKSFVHGASFMDSVDDCDVNTTCDMVCGAPRGGTEGNSFSHH
jgi:Flp pilus assembly pilin Flp